MSGYITVSAFGEGEIIEKRSRFIAAVKPVTTEEEALAFLAERKQLHREARHNVYAYILRENNLMRYSDDGEPSGTAGMPVFDMLRKEGLTDIVVVVTRYFGGTLLGTGGLVHAYSKSAKEGILAAGKIEMRLCEKLDISCDYTLLGKIQNELKKWDLQEEEPVFTDSVTLPVYLPKEDSERFQKAMIEATNSRITITACGTEYHQKPIINE